MKTTLPKNFVKEAQSPTMEGIKKSVLAYYGGEEKRWEKTETGFDLYSVKRGTKLSCFVIETPRGFYFGYFV